MDYQASHRIDACTRCITDHCRGNHLHESVDQGAGMNLTGWLRFECPSSHFEADDIRLTGLNFSTISWSSILASENKMTMKKLLTILSILLPLVITAQSTVYQVPISHHNIQVRLPDPFLLDSITIQVPDSGKVFVRFDGICTTTPGDNILLAASNYRDWNTNDGNIGVFSFDSTNRNRPFNHTRIYTVDGGTSQTFYAMVHNWTDQEGDGIVSVEGQLTVIYVPNDADDYVLAGKGFYDGLDVWDNVPTVIDTVIIHVPTAGQLIINSDGTFYTSFEDTAMLAVNLSPTWPAQGQVETFFMPNEYNNVWYSHRRVFPVAAGTHTIYTMVRKTTGQDFTSWNGLYTTLTALFIPDNAPSTIEEILSGTQVDQNDAPLLEQIQLDAPRDGKVYVSFTGRLDSHGDDEIELTLEHVNGDMLVIDAKKVRAVLSEDGSTSVTLSAVVDVPAGNQTFQLKARYTDESVGTGEGEIRGYLTADFFAPEEITATRPVIADQTVSLYPNPTTGTINATLPENAADGTFNIQIISASGQVLKHGVFNPAQQQIDLGELPNGLYLVTLQHGESIEVHPVQKISTIR
jgi:hypothetical protein